MLFIIHFFNSVFCRIVSATRGPIGLHFFCRIISRN